MKTKIEIETLENKLGEEDKKLLSILKDKEEDELAFLLKICLSLYETNDRIMKVSDTKGNEIILSERKDFIRCMNLLGFILDIFQK